MSRGPVLIDLEEEAQGMDVADAPPVPDTGPRALEPRPELPPARPARLFRWFWGLAVAGIGAVISLAAWDMAASLIARQPVLGWAVSAVFVALLVVGGLIALRELAAISRLRRIDGFRSRAVRVIAERDVPGARELSRQLTRFYAARQELRWGRARLAESAQEAFDADAVLDLVESELLAPLDAAALLEVEAAARRVATVTALVPLALADMFTALVSSVRMIRRVSEIYGGRSGFFGSWSLARAVLAHLAATGAVAIGDDVLEPVLGGSILSKLSRRFGEGLVNGALSARVGVAAMEVCRPVPFGPKRRPSVKGIVRRALSGLFARR